MFVYHKRLRTKPAATSSKMMYENVGPWFVRPGVDYIRAGWTSLYALKKEKQLCELTLTDHGYVPIFHIIVKVFFLTQWSYTIVLLQSTCKNKCWYNTFFRYMLKITTSIVVLIFIKCLQESCLSFLCRCSFF